MIRLLMLTPVIVVLCVGYLGYLAFKGHQEGVQSNVQSLSAWSALKDQQKTVIDGLSQQKTELEAQSNEAEDLRQELDKDMYTDFDLVELKQGINAFNLRSKQLAKNEGDLLQLNEYLTSGMDSLKLKIAGANTEPKRSSLKKQMLELMELQQKFIDKAEDYERQAKENAEAMRQRIIDQHDRIADLKSSQKSNLKDKLDYFRDRQQDMLRKIEDQRQHLAEVRQQLNDRMQSYKERVADMMEQNKTRMEDAKQRAKEQKQIMKDRVADQMQRIRDQQRNNRH